MISCTTERGAVVAPDRLNTRLGGRVLAGVGELTQTLNTHALFRVSPVARPRRAPRRQAVSA